MRAEPLEIPLRAALRAYELAHQGPRRWWRGRAPSPFADGVDALVRDVCAAPARHVRAMVLLARTDALRHPAAASPWWELVQFLGQNGRRATEDALNGDRWSPLDEPWTTERTRAGAQRFLAALGGPTRPLGFGPPVALLALFTAARSGWVREAVLDELGAREAVDALPFIAARLADRVPEVRAAARRALTSLAVPLNARALLVAHPELARARQRPHFDSEACVQQVEALLRSQARTGLFLERLRDPDQDLRRTAFDFALETESTAVVGGVIRRAIASGDSLVLSRGIQALGRLDEDEAGREERASILEHGLTHRSRRVRRNVLAVCPLDAAGRPTVPESLLDLALLDPTREGRALARRVSGRTHEELLDFYRARVADEQRKAPARSGFSPAWYGLVELRDTEAAARLEASLRTPGRFTARGRRDALRALRLAQGALAAPTLIEALGEPALANEAARGLVAVGAVPPLAALRQLADADEPRLIRAAVLLASKSKEVDRYEELSILLHAARPRALAGSAEPVSLEAVHHRVQEWLRRTNGRILPPGPEEASALLALLARAHTLTAAARKELALRLGRGEGSPGIDRRDRSAHGRP